jgi:uncharacterized DUF497 family protein
VRTTRFAPSSVANRLKGRKLRFGWWWIGIGLIPPKWDIEYDPEKLSAHGITEWEAAEVIWNEFAVLVNMKVHGPHRYQLLGRTDSGRPIKLIVHFRWPVDARDYRMAPMTKREKKLTDGEIDALV